MRSTDEEDAARRAEFHHHHSCTLCRNATVKQMERWRAERHWIPALHAKQWLWEESQLNEAASSAATGPADSTSE